MVNALPEIPVFLLNLDRDTERLAYMQAQLASAGLAYERIPAVDGRQREASTFDTAMFGLQGGAHTLLPGELGCAASHLQAYEKILDRNLPHALVLEDDVEIPLDFKSILAQEITKNSARGTWEYLLFDYWKPGTAFARQWLLSAMKQYSYARSKGLLSGVGSLLYSSVKAVYIIPVSLIEGMRNQYAAQHPGPVRFYRPLYLAGAYLVTQAGARKLYDLNTPIRYTADALPNEARTKSGLRFFAYAPLVVRQLKSTFGSSILGTSGEHT